MKKTLLFVLLIHTFLFSQIMILKNQDKIIIDNNQTLALNHVNHDQKQILKEYNSIDPRVKKLLEEKPKKDSNLSKEDEELSNKVVNVIQTIGNVYNAKDSKERDEFIRDLASNYLSLQANTLIQEYLHTLNHSINSEFNLNYNDRGGLSGNAKVLLPIMSEDNPKISYFLQSGIGGYDNNRIIGHFGGGIRYYPNALALDNSGNIMLGLNLVYDHDFSREHKRISLGFESMLDTLAFHANIYQRLSDWVSSYDFKNANNDLTFLERPANGWDMGIKYAFPSMSNVAIFANMSKWYGEKVAPFGNVNCYEDLEKNPLVYEGGITYSPCPALTFSLSHKRSNESDKQGTNIAMNFNIPLDKDAFKHAFDTKLAGINNTIEGSRTHFIDRDYSMVLEYKAINNTYHISYCGNLGGNTHCIMLKDGFNQAVKNVAMSVTPEQKSVILKDGNHYITDSNGKVFVKIIHSYGVHQTNLIAKAGNAQESFPITIIAPKEDFRIFAKPSNIQRYEKSLITFTGNDLAGDLAIHWKLNGKGSLEKTPNSDKTDKDGNSNIIYKPDVNMKDKEKAEIIVNVLGVTLKTFVQIAIYGDNDIILDKAIIGNKEKTHASYKNLKANSTKVKWSIQGDNALFVDKDKTTKELNLIADDKGESNVEIIGLSGNEKVKIIAKNMSDELVKERSKDLEIKNYTATMELPAGKDPVTYQDFEKGMIDYKSDFEVKLKGLMPKTKVLWKAKDIQSNKTLRISNDKESTADDKGESKVVFEGVKDFNIKRLQIIATYNQSAASTQEVSGEIKLHQYTPSISFSKDKIHAYESDNNKALKDPKLDHVEVTLKGGKPNEKIEWSLSGDATLSNQEATFNASGEAKAVITSKAPFKVNPNLEVKTMTKDLKKELPYEIKEYTPKVEYPSFKTQEKTIDYIDDFNIKISGLLPNSTIDKISGSKGVKAKKESFNVNNKGEATLEFSGISDYSVKDIAIKFNYIEQGSVKKELNLDKIKLYQYAISFNADPSTIIAEPNKNAEVTLKGGKPNEKIEWSLSGGATLTKTDKVFNASGEAKAVITSKAPFKTNPVISVNTLGQNLTKTLTYIDGTIYTPKIEYPSYKVSFWKTLD
ncbi:inverse autotransporter beta domain-containing protein, partial [Campylobacter sp. IFREMER_LSEM_CL908]|uniref:inverse autotransporter beta domain-containing protein n=1 Tax=Campylobacter sp. IFREMER_LSEM_CL908 TaxID=2911624 RepID=UPI0021E7880A